MFDMMPRTCSRATLQLVLNRLLEGRVVPFLGASVNVCERPDKFIWGDSEENGRELARELARNFDYQKAIRTCEAPVDQWLRLQPEFDLARISQ